MWADGQWVHSSLIFWGAVVLMIVARSFFRHRSRVAKYKMMETLAEKGQTLSPELMASMSNGRDRDDRHGGPIQSGIFLMCIGIALAIFFWALCGGGNFFQGEHIPNWLPVIGIFPFMVGLARFIGGLTERRPPK
jgi:hypothetical protein